MREPHWIKFDALVSLSLDGTLTNSQRSELERLVQTSDAHRRRYLELCALHGSLAWIAPNLPPTSSTRPTTVRSWFQKTRWKVAFLLMAACVLIAAILFVTNPSPKSKNDSPTFVVEELVGRGVVTKDGNQIGDLAIGDTLRPGQTIHLEAEDGYAVVKMPRGGHLQLSGGTTIRFASWKPEEDIAQAFVSQGVVRATGAKSGQQIILETPHAKIEMHDTVLTCVVASDATRVENEEGQAQVVRMSDNRTLSLPSGSYAITSADSMEDLVSFRLVKRVDVPRFHVRLAGSALALSPTGNVLATALRNKVTLWGSKDGAEMGSLTIPDFHARRLAFSPDGRLLALADASGNVEVWNLLDQRRTNRWEGTGSVSRLAFHPNGQTLAMTDDDPQRNGGVRLLSLQGLPVRTWNVAHVTALAFSPDGLTLAVGTDSGDLRLWDPATEIENRLTSNGRQKNAIRSLAFSRSGNQIACLRATNVVQVWDRKTARVVHEVPSLGRHIRELLFMDDDRRMAFGTLDGTLTIWDFAHDEELESRHLDSRSILTLRYDATGKTLTVVSASGYIHRWSVAR